MGFNAPRSGPGGGHQGQPHPQHHQRSLGQSSAGRVCHAILSNQPPLSRATYKPCRYNGMMNPYRFPVFRAVHSDRLLARATSGPLSCHELTVRAQRSRCAPLSTAPVCFGCFLLLPAALGLASVLLPFCVVGPRSWASFPSWIVPFLGFRSCSRCYTYSHHCVSL